MKLILISHKKVPMAPHRLVRGKSSKTVSGGAKHGVLQSLSNLAISATRPVKHLVGGASAFTPAKMPSVIRKSPIGKIF